MKVETKVGIFVLAALTVLMVGAAYVGNFTFGGSGYIFTVQYSQSSGLRPRSKLKMGGGEEIGYVQKIEYDRSAQKTNVYVKVYEGNIIYKDSKFTIDSSNLMGDKFINVGGGTKETGDIRPGDLVIGDESSGLSGMMGQVGGVMTEMQKTLSTMNGILGTKETRVSIQKAISGLAVTVESSQPKIVNILDNIETMTKAMAKAAQSLNEMSASMNKMAGEKNQQAFTATMANMKEMTDKLNTTLGHVDAVTAKIEKGEGAVGVLLSDKKMGEDLKGFMKDLRDNPNMLIFGKPKKP